MWQVVKAYCQADPVRGSGSDDVQPQGFKITKVDVTDEVLGSFSTTIHHSFDDEFDDDFDNDELLPFQRTTALGMATSSTSFRTQSAVSLHGGVFPATRRRQKANRGVPYQRHAQHKGRPPKSTPRHQHKYAYVRGRRMGVGG